MQEYWIEGHFGEFWTGKSFYDPKRDIYIPTWAIINLKWYDSPVKGEDRDYERFLNGKVLIKPSFAKQQLEKFNALKNTKKFSWQNTQHYYLSCFCKALNVPYVPKKEEYTGPEVALL